jgi:hypothetical protein
MREKGVSAELIARKQKHNSLNELISLAQRSRPCLGKADGAEKRFGVADREAFLVESLEGLKILWQNWAQVKRYHRHFWT